MKAHKKVTYRISENQLLEIDILKLMNSVEPKNTRTTKSSIIKNCLLESFGLFENELVENGGKPFEKIPKKFSDSIPITITLPFEVVDELDYYSTKLGIKKSHLVGCSIDMVLTQLHHPKIKKTYI